MKTVAHHGERQLKGIGVQPAANAKDDVSVVPGEGDDSSFRLGTIGVIVQLCTQHLPQTLILTADLVQLVKTF